MVYDYIVGGIGAAGLQLALAMARDDFFKNKHILLIDASTKLANDRRWCFWEEGDGQWDALISAQWEHVVVRTPWHVVDQPMGKYRYKMLTAGAFNRYALEQLAEYKNIHRVTDIIEGVDASQQPVLVKGQHGMYTGTHFFDSRVEEPPGRLGHHQVRVYQHFRGWEVETATDFFNPNKVELMDFTQAKPETCSFMYVLPFSARKALVEFTVFSSTTWLPAEYEEYLKNYLGGLEYKITALEEGVIPMTTVPYHLAGGPFHTKIGTAGSWVKPSTGYSFKRAEGKIKQVLSNIKQGRPPAEGLIIERFRYYDRLMLDILARRNWYGVVLFDTLYRKNSLPHLFRFLDEETRFADELRIMLGFNPLPFLVSIVRSIRHYLLRSI